MKLYHFLPAIGWFIISTYLLCIPGNDLPHSALDQIPFFDKWVHLGMFYLLTLGFCYPLIRTSILEKIIFRYFIWIALAVWGFGIAMEFVQKYLVVNRSFDEVDILFDGIGSAAGLLISRRLYKKIGPDRNRGRNQN